jgi:hypothetical protein
MWTGGQAAFATSEIFNLHTRHCTAAPGMLVLSCDAFTQRTMLSRGEVPLPHQSQLSASSVRREAGVDYSCLHHNIMASELRCWLDSDYAITASEVSRI